MSTRAGALLAVAALGCAQVGTPPGGQPDDTPPRVRAVEPAALDTLTELRDPVIFRFDERISERLEGVSEWDEAVVVSPATSEVRVRRKRRHIEVSLVGGWEAGRVYRVTLRPVYRDLFGNVREEPVELVFSTGAGFDDAAIAGFATDRITGQPVVDALLLATRRIDGTVYQARTDTAGFFALRFMPAGGYDLVAWSDQDRDREVDFFEIQDSAGIAVGAADTTIATLALLPGDSTPARLARADALDSTTVRLLFDDYFAPGPVDGHAGLLLLPDSVPGPHGALIHSTALDSVRAARADTVPAEADSLTVRVDPGVARPGQTGGRQDPEEESEPLPSQELVVLLAAPLLPDTTYAVRVRDVTNIRGLEGGGGVVAFRSPAPPPPDTTAPDTVPPDTVPPDTVPPGTVPPDTVPLDTIAPDTIPRDTVPWAAGRRRGERS